MDTTKIIARYAIPGATLLKEEDAEKNFAECHDRFTVTATEKVGKNKIDRTTYNVFTRKCYPAYITVKMNDDAYKAFTDKDNRPEWYKHSGDWRKLTKTQRVEQHIKRDCEYRGGTSSSFEILPD